MSSLSPPNQIEPEPHGVFSKTKAKFRRFRDSISPQRHGKHEPNLLAVFPDQIHGPNALQVTATLSHTNDENSSGEINGSKSLWNLAFEDFQKANPDLIEKFRYCLGTESELNLVHNPNLATKDMVQGALSKINDISDSKGALNGKSDKIRKYFEQTIKLVISAKEFISAAVALNPYAATAWTGICLVLPLLLSPSKENDASIEGVSYIANLMIIYTWKERIYLGKDAALDFTGRVKSLYVEILIYQATLLVHMHRNPPSRWGRDVFKAGDWQNRIIKIKDLDSKCRQLTDVIADVRAQQWREEEQKWHETRMRFLLENGADIEAKDPNGWTPLHYATMSGHETMTRLLLKNGADIKGKDFDEWTPLHYAAERGHETMIPLLLENGGDIDAKDHSGKTLLHNAAIIGDEMMTRLLLENGADIDAKDDSRMTPLHYAMNKEHETMMRLLLENGADIDAKDDSGMTPLHYAAIIGDETMMRLLLKNGADVEAENTSGWTPLHYAVKMGDETMMRLLLKNGADIETEDISGWTLLHYAARTGRQTMIPLLLKNGADIDAKDHSGKTALDYARQNGHEEVVQLLEASSNPLPDLSTPSTSIQQVL